MLVLVQCFHGGGVLNFIIFPGENYMYFVEDPIGLNLPIPFQIPYFAFITFYIALFYLIPYFKNKIAEKSKNKSGKIEIENKNNDNVVEETVISTKSWQKKKKMLNCIEKNIISKL